MTVHPDTVRVQPWGQDQGDFVVINRGDFDPAIHKPYPAEAAGKEPAPTGLAALTVADLKKLAGDKEVELGDATKKDDIVAVLEAAGVEPPAAE